MTIPDTLLTDLNSTRTAMLFYINEREPVVLSTLTATLEQIEALEWLDGQGLIGLTKGGSCAVTTRVGHAIVLELLKPSTEK